MNIFMDIADTILMPSGTAQDKHKKHLFVVMCKPVDDYVLLVSVATCRFNYDETCILNKDDHRFIKHKSYVVYQLAEVKLVKHLQDGIKNRLYRRHSPMSDSVFQKILKGFGESAYTKNFVWEYLPKKL